MSLNQTDVASIRFLTGSSFEGSWNESVRMMDGFGSYRYPDGSEYRGRFVEGKFHGYGHLKLTQPFRFTIKGEFERGKLVTIEDMWFNDGLHVQGSFQDDQFICDDWDYLTPSDRRYQTERFYGQQPVGPTAYLTSTLLARTVPHKCYDVEEGIFNAKTGWLCERTPPFSKAVYVGCPQEKAWIIRHCRGERKENVREPLPSFCRQIINNNLETELRQLKDITIYAPDKEIQRERYFPKLCHDSATADNQTVDQEQIPFTRPPFQKIRSTTELCLLARFAKEQELAKQQRLSDKLPPARARVWTSSSDPLSGDSGATNTISKSPSDVSLHTNVKTFYDNAFPMIQKIPTGSLHVVQSNMKRPGSFVDITGSVFEL